MSLRPAQLSASSLVQPLREQKLVGVKEAEPLHLGPKRKYRVFHLKNLS